MLAGTAMEMRSEETPLALQRLWSLTRARLAGTSTALDGEPALVETLPPVSQGLLLFNVSGLLFLINVVNFPIDPRIIPGFNYRVRPAGCRRYLFEGRSLLLQSIGMGYGKRLTFKPDTLNTPENYFWSDSHPEGVGMEPRAIHPGMKFSITGNGGLLGEACVFRADLPQVEEKTEYVNVPGKKGSAVEKYIHVDVTCHVKLATTGGGSVDSEVHLMKVSGVALIRKDPGQAIANLVKVFNVGLDSQLNLLFAHSQTELTFHPLP